MRCIHTCTRGEEESQAGLVAVWYATVSALHLWANPFCAITSHPSFRHHAAPKADSMSRAGSATRCLFGCCSSEHAYIHAITSSRALQTHSPTIFQPGAQRQEVCEATFFVSADFFSAMACNHSGQTVKLNRSTRCRMWIGLLAQIGTPSRKIVELTNVLHTGRISWCAWSGDAGRRHSGLPRDMHRQAAALLFPF